MSTPSTYKVDLRNLHAESETREFVADDAFFRTLNVQDIQGGQVRVKLIIRKSADHAVLTIQFNGDVTVKCDRCLEPMTLPVEGESVLRLKLGDTYDDDGECITIPEREGIADIAWNVYECIALAVPITHIHTEGDCNPEMLGLLKQHENNKAETETSEETDPRWNALKKILDK